MAATGVATLGTIEKVLVVGMGNLKLQAEHSKRVVWKNHWELFSLEGFPRDVDAVCLSDSLHPDHIRRLTHLARQAGVKTIEVETSNESLVDRLKFWFGASMEDVALAIRDMEGAIRIPTKRIRPMKGQPRTHFSIARMNELMTSIKAIGQVMPILVIRIKDDPDHDFELIEGERRLRSCLTLGIPEMLAIVRTVTDNRSQFISSFVANFARDGHTAFDTARGIAKILSFPEFKELTRGEAIKRVAALAGKSEVWVYQHLKLLTLPEEVIKLLEPDNRDRFTLPLSVGIFLTSIADRDIQLKVCDEVVKNKLSMNQARNLGRRLAIEAGLTAGSAQRNPSKDYTIMRGYIKRTMEGAENLLTMPHRSLDELFMHRGLEERNKVIQDIEKSVALLTRLRKAVMIKQPAARK